jgi:hypothetical protein
MKSRGFFKVPRGLRDLFSDDSTPTSEYEAFLCLVEQARGITSNRLKPGQLEPSYTELEAAWRWERSRVRRYIEKLQELPSEDPRHLTVVSPGNTPRGKSTIYAITNFHLYNGKNAEKPIKPAFDTASGTGCDSASDTVKPAPAVSVSRGTTQGATQSTTHIKEENVSENGLESASSFSSSSDSQIVPHLETDDDDQKPAREKTRNQWALEIIAEYDVPAELAHAAADIAIARHFGVAKKGDPIRSVRFFAEIIEELRSQWPLPKYYPKYLQQKATDAIQTRRST